MSMIFCKTITTWPDQRLLGRSNKPGPKPKLSASEVMTIHHLVPSVPLSGLQGFLSRYVCQHLRSEFPNLVSYNRFVELLPGTLLPMCLYMTCPDVRSHRDCFRRFHAVSVCHNKRIDATRPLPAWPPRQDLNGLLLWLQIAPGGQ